MKYVYEVSDFDLFTFSREVTKLLNLIHDFENPYYYPPPGGG